jgi:ubiquinone/menaquinone biosynthesis C-methylase UbiE
VPTEFERAVEKFYSHGVEKYGDYHEGYLNYGLWEPGIDDYVRAAERMVEKMGTLLGLGPGARLVDVACGMGSQDIFLSRRFGPIEIDAVDLTRKHIEHGRRKAARAGLEASLRFHQASATQLPFSDGEFSHALSLEAAHHFRTREDFFREAHRVLRPGGVLALADYVLKRAPRRWERLVFDATLALWKVPRENAYDRATYEAKLRAAGFKNLQVEEVGALTFPGYYWAQRQPEKRRELARIRGFIAGRLGHALDIAGYKIYEMGLVDFVLVRAER